MKIAIIHLSDVHIRTSADTVLKRAEKIASAAKSVEPDPDAYLLGITGDVAFSGKNQEYEIAAHFFREIVKHLSSEGKSVFKFVLPGNHDLDFSTELDTRPRLLESIRDGVEGIDFDGETVRQLIAVQQNFFAFEASMQSRDALPTGKRLAYSDVFKVGGKDVSTRCFNTAWASTNPEVQGKLVYPTAAADTESNSAGLAISAFHHPYNWLASENASAFRQRIEATSDVILTGHEHESSIYVKTNSDGSTAQYIEGAVLQESGSDRSAFNVVIIDTEAATYEAFLCSWKEGIYQPTSFGPHPFIRNKLACNSTFRNNRQFLEVLSDPGIPILHPSKREVNLEDLYVYPAFACKNPDKKFEVTKVINGVDVSEYVASLPYLLIVGEETSGKTSLAKTLYRDFLRKGDFVPILVNGEDFDGCNEKDLRKIIKKKAAWEYDESAVERYFQLDHDQRALIIDDWHNVKYAAKGRAAIIDGLKTLFGKVVCLTNRLYAFDELAESGPLRSVFSDFQFCDIKEFGKRSTGKLIEKWHSLGRDYDSDSRAYHYAVASSEHKISVIMGKGILPTYPIFLIGLLQADASPTPAAQSAGSYGHILESLITARLAEVSKRSTDVGLMYTYASRIAYFLFRRDRLFLSPRELSELHKEYCKTYQMNLPEAPIVADLIRARILRKDGDSYAFVYKGCYCYFVARYFAENLASNESALREQLDEITDRLAWEDYTNIVMFFLYLTRDQRIIQRLLANAGEIYAECAPSDLDTDVKFVNGLMREPPKRLLLPSTDIDENRDQYRRQQDESEVGSEETNQVAPSQRVPYAPELNEILKITLALQNLRVMGQVLRNFPGVLTAEPKLQLAEASYLLGLRTLRRFLTLAEQQLEELRASFGQIFKNKHPLSTQEEIEDSADQKLIWLAGAVSYGVIKKICNSIGLQDLELTFAEVREKLGEKTSVKLIDLAIQLEYFREAPESEIFDCERELKKNWFSYKLLRDLVAEFLYLHNTDTKVFQRLGQLFRIDTGDPRFLLNKVVGTLDK